MRKDGLVGERVYRANAIVTRRLGAVAVRVERSAVPGENLDARRGRVEPATEVNRPVRCCTDPSVN